MRKFTTLMAAFAATIAVNAATVTWNAADITDLANGDIINDKTFVVNDNISFTVAKGGSDKDCVFRKSSTNPATVIVYSKGTITFTSTDATITSIKFIVNTSEGSTNTPGWSFQDSSKTLYNAENDTWTGETNNFTFTDKSSAQLTSLEITYSVDEGSETPDPTPGEFKTAELFFNESQVASGTDAQNVKLSNNGVEIVFTSDSSSAKLEANKNGYFGTTEEYITLPYRYSPGGKSTKGIESTNKGVITLPCDGTLYIYASNNQEQDRIGEIIQNNVTVFSHTYSASEAVNPEGSERKVYPVYSAELKKGTAYFLWPTNQLMLFGFKFEPEKSISTVVEEIEITDIKDMPAYDLMGRRVSDNYKGIVIQGGKKFIRK